MHKIILLLTTFLLLAGAASAEIQQGKVSWVYDGDTIKVTGVGKVRLIGIDSPEKEKSPRDEYYLRHEQIDRRTLREVAQQALHFNLDRVRNQRVTLEFDRDRIDKYGRTLAYVILPDGQMLNRLLLEKGLAAVYRRFNFRLKKDFLRAEKVAREQRKGLWHK